MNPTTWNGLKTSSTDTNITHPVCKRPRSNHGRGFYSWNQALNKRWQNKTWCVKLERAAKHVIPFCYRFYNHIHPNKKIDPSRIDFPFISRCGWNLHPICAPQNQNPLKIKWLRGDFCTQGGNRTRTSLRDTGFWVQRVYQFRHLGVNSGAKVDLFSQTPNKMTFFLQEKVENIYNNILSFP